MELKDRIAELCARATTEKDPAALKIILDELKFALSEYIRGVRQMTILHFDYFRKQHRQAARTDTDAVKDSEKEAS